MFSMNEAATLPRVYLGGVGTNHFGLISATSLQQVSNRYPRVLRFEKLDISYTDVVVLNNRKSKIRHCGHSIF